LTYSSATLHLGFLICEVRDGISGPLEKAESVAQWQGTGMAGTRPWDPSSTKRRRRRKNEKEEEEGEEGEEGEEEEFLH
jgi:hypothetical protein